MPFENTAGVIPVVDQAFALDREHRHAGFRNGRSRMVLGRIDVAGGPPDVGAERSQRLDQHRRLDGHVQGARDASALEGLLGPVFLACCHQAGHFGFGDIDLVAAPGGERDVLDDVVAGLGLRLGRSGHSGS